jgi:hypothetical protein
MHAEWVLQMISGVSKPYPCSLCDVPLRAVPIVASTSSPSLLYGFVHARLCVPTAYAIFNYV